MRDEEFFSHAVQRKNETYLAQLMILEFASDPLEMEQRSIVGSHVISVSKRVILLTCQPTEPPDAVSDSMFDT